MLATIIFHVLRECIRVLEQNTDLSSAQTSASAVELLVSSDLAKRLAWGTDGKLPVVFVIVCFAYKLNSLDSEQHRLSAQLRK